MRTEQQINAELACSAAEYHAVANTASAPDLAARSKKIKALREELAATLVQGAKPCPKCKTTPHAMCKTPAHVHRGEEKAPTYEVGCLTCDAYARSFTIERAVAAWNKQ